MSRNVLLPLVAMLMLLAASCSEQRITEPVAGREVVVESPEELWGPLAAAIADRSGWALAPEHMDASRQSRSQHVILSYEREMLAPGIAHYTYELRLGPGEYDILGLHRVVRERRPYHPITTQEALFVQHGAGVDFRHAFLACTFADGVPNGHAIPIFLAQNDVDVWGIDMPWTRIPADAEDFSFAADWGLQREVDNLRTGISLARVVRLLTGNGWSQLDLLAWSQSVSTGYIYLAQESQLPPVCRHIRGFIPVDEEFITDSPESIAGACASSHQIEAERAEGIFVDSTGALANFAAYLAMTDPDGMSPILPWLTNYQTVLVAVSQTFILGNPIPFYHLLAGVFNEDGLPIDLQFVYTEFGIDFYAAWSPYQPNLIIKEIYDIVCAEGSSPFADHLGDITVPVFCLGAGGGTGDAGSYMATQVGSTDFESLVVSTSADPFLDFGHADLFVASQGASAEDLVWQPILDWMEARN